MTLTAAYTSPCALCGGLVTPGDTYVWAHVVTGDAVAHATCQPRAPRHGDQCPIHHLTMPLSGACVYCEEEK